MKRIILALALLALPSIALANDCSTGIFNPGQGCGNIGAIPAPPTTFDLARIPSTLTIKAPVKAASTANVNIASAPASLDGVTGVAGDRWLLTNQTTDSENGVRIFTAAGAALARAADFNATAQVVQGTQVYVTQGTLNGKHQFSVTSTNPIAIGTDAITFVLSPAFIQTGTNAVTRTAQDKSRERISVYDYGATCDGSADDLTAFNRAHAALAAQGGTIIVPSLNAAGNRSVCQLSATWSIGLAGGLAERVEFQGSSVLQPRASLTSLVKINFGNTTITGSGSIANNGSFATNGIEVAKPACPGAGCDSYPVTISNLSLTSFTNAILWTDGQTPVIKDTFLVANTNGIVFLNAGTAALIQNNYIQTGNGIKFSWRTDGTGQEAEGVVITGNNILAGNGAGGGGTYALKVEGGLAFEISGNILDAVYQTAAAGWGVYLDGSITDSTPVVHAVSGFNFSNNFMQAGHFAGSAAFFATGGVAVNGIAFLTMQNNAIWQAAGFGALDGISLNYIGNGNINGNEFHATTARTIHNTGVAGVNFSFNTNTSIGTGMVEDATSNNTFWSNGSCSSGSASSRYNCTGAVSVTGGLPSSGVLPVNYGGTGLSAGTSGGILGYTGTGTIASSGLLTQYGMVYGGGAGATPAATAAATDGQLWVGQTGAAPLLKTISGDVTFTAAGATAIGSTKVTSAMLNADVFSTAHSWAGIQTLSTPVFTGLPTGTGVATANTVSTLVARDGSGNFAAGTITAALAGNATTASGAPPTGSAGGDLGGTYPNPSVAKVNGVTLGTTAPGISACGTGSPAVTAGSNNLAGQFTMGTGTPTACTITFDAGAPYANYAFCTVSPANAAAAGIVGSEYFSAQSKTGFTITLAIGTSSAAFNYNCNGH